MKRKPNRNPASKHISVVNTLNAAMNRSRVNRVVVSELVGVPYIVMDKYLRKERNINDEEVARRMLVTAQLLNKMTAKGILPIEEEINMRLRTAVILEAIEQFINEGNHD